MSDLRERLRYLRSRLGAEKTQLSLVSLAAVLIMVTAVIALPGGGGDQPSAVTEADPSTYELELRTRAPTVPDDDGSPRGGSRRSSSTVSASIDDPRTGAISDDPAGDGEIRVGVTYLEDPGQANAAAGFTGIGQVDQRRGWEAVIADINRDPPFGRKVVPVWFSVTENEFASRGSARVAQEACAYFTQDNQVSMVWVGTLGAGEDTLSSCLTRARIPQISFSTGTSYGKTFSDFPYLVEPTTAAMDRMAAFYVDGLRRAGFFASFKDNVPPYTPTKPADGKPKVALIRYDQPSHKAGAAAVKQRLAAHGLALCDGCEYEVTYSADDVVEQLNDASQVNTAIQNCKSRPGGPCTHVLFLGSAAQRIPVFFMDGAEKQAYRPRIGFSPLDSWNFIREFLGPSTDPQFSQSQLVTWTPGDFGDTTDTYTRCKDLFLDAGETFEGSEAAAKEDAISNYCDVAWYHTAVMRAAGADLNLDTWLRGVGSVEPVPSAGSYLMRTTPQRRDGIGAIRMGRWADGCSCFEAATPVTPV